MLWRHNFFKIKWSMKLIGGYLFIFWKGFLIFSSWGLYLKSLLAYYCLTNFKNFTLKPFDLLTILLTFLWASLYLHLIMFCLGEPWKHRSSISYIIKYFISWQEEETKQVFSGTQSRTGSYWYSYLIYSSLLALRVEEE